MLEVHASIPIIDTFCIFLFPKQQLARWSDAFKIVEDGLKTNGDNPDLKALKDEIMPHYEREQKNAFSKMSKEVTRGLICNSEWSLRCLH